MDSNSTSSFFIKLWLWTGIGLIIAMVLIGGITRLTGSGLSIVEWKIVSGSIPPLTEQQWQAEFDHYKQFPEYKKLNVGMTLSEYKSIYRWEYVHRLLGRLIGVMFIVPFIFFWKKKWVSRRLFKRLAIIFLLGALQGIAGWFMVYSGLQEHPHVSHFRLALHLMLALTLIAVMLWTIVGLEHEDHPGDNSNLSFPLVCIGLIVVQIVLGAFVAGLKAGYSYTNFPWMGESFLPAASVVKSTSLIYNGVVLQFIHRWLAFVVLGATLILYAKTRKITSTRRVAGTLHITVCLQVILGILTLIFQVPIVLGVAHQFVAVVLFMLTLMVILKLRYARP